MENAQPLKEIRLADLRQQYPGRKFTTSTEKPDGALDENKPMPVSKITVVMIGGGPVAYLHPDDTNADFDNED